MGLYSGLENKWYDFIDWLNQYIPIAKLTDRIDRVIPSFLLFIIIIFLLLIIGAFSLSSNFSQQGQLIVLSKNGLPIEGVEVKIIGNCSSEQTLVTNFLGKAEFSACTNVFSVVAVKEGYLDYEDEVLLENGKAEITLNPKVIARLSKTFHAEIIDGDEELISGANLELICLGGSRTNIGSQSNNGFDFEIPTTCSSAQLKATATGYQEKTVNITSTEERKIIELEQEEVKSTLIIETNNSLGAAVQAEIVLTQKISGKVDTYFTDPSGSKTVQVSSGEYSYVASTSIGQTEEGEFIINPRQVKTIEITFEHVTQQVIDDSNIISIIIVSEDNNTNVFGATPTLYRDGNNAGILMINQEDKVYRRNILPNQMNSTYYISISAVDYESKIIQVFPKSKNLAPTKILLRKGGAQLKINLIDDANIPVKNASVSLVSIPSGIQTGFVTPDNNGVARFTNLQSGSYRIKASTIKEEGELTVALTTDEIKEITIRLVIGEGTIKYKFIDNKSVNQNPFYTIFENVSGEYQKFSEGTAKNGYVETPKLKVGTKLKLVVTDGNYFETETKDYQITRLRQDKTIILRKINDLPNNNRVQMFLDAIYETNPIYGSAQNASRLLPGRKYYFGFSVVLNNSQEEAKRLVSNFFVSPKDVNVLMQKNMLKINSAYSINDSTVLMTNLKKSSIIDPVSQQLVDFWAKQANVINESKAPKLIPIIVEVEVDANATGKVGIYFESIYNSEQSLLYSREMNIGETFCFASSNSSCPEVLFSNYIKWNDIKSTSREFVPLGEEPFVIFVGDNYELKTISENLTDTLIGDVNLSLLIKKESVDNILFEGDKNKFSSRINLAPLNKSTTVESKFNVIKSGNSEKIYESIERIANGLNELRNLSGNDFVLRFDAKSKNQLELGISPSTIEAGANYPLFLIKTKYSTKSGGVSAKWYAEKIDSQGNSLGRLGQGTTDANGYEITSFNALNLSIGDKVRFVASDDNGALDGIKIVTVTSSIVFAQPEIHECLSVTIDTTKVSEINNFFKTVNKNDSFSIRVDSNCDEERLVGFHTDLLLSENQFTVPSKSNKTITLTAKQRGELFGAYPVQIVTVDSSTYKQLAYFDVVIKGAQCFDLEQAIFDLRTTGKISSKVINTCFEGRKDNFYPKMNISTNSVSLSYKKPGLPEKVNGTITYSNHAVEGLVQGFSWGQQVTQKRGDGCGTPTSTIVPYTADFVYIEEGLKNCEIEVEKYTSFDPPEKEEPDVPQTDPSIPFYALPVLVQERILSQLISETGNWTTTTNTDANLASSNQEKFSKIYFNDLSVDFYNPNEVKDAGEDSVTGVGTTGSSTKKIDAEPISPTMTTNEDGEAKGNSEKIQKGDVYQMRIGTPEYLPVLKCELQNILAWVAYDRPPGFDFAMEKWGGGGERNFDALIIEEAKGNNGGNCAQKKLTQYTLFEEDSGIPVTLVTEGSRTCSGLLGLFCKPVTCTVVAHNEFHRVVTALQEQIAYGQKDFNIVPIEGKVYNIGRYESPLVPIWTQEKDAHGILVGEEMVDEVNRLTTNCVDPLGFVALETTRGDFGAFPMPDPADPLVEYDSDRSFVKIATESIPEGFRAFLKNGNIYVEYIGVPEIPGPNIDFNITKVNLLGNEYAIISIQDWVSGTEKKEQLFQVKLTGAPTTCYSSEGIEGMTGQQFVPRLLFDWSWDSISDMQCDSKNNNYTYCDATQFNISLFKRLALMENYLKTGNQNTYVAKSAFYAYLLKDNYNEQFLDDFEEYYSQAFSNTPSFFNTSSLSVGFDKFITENKISFKEATTNTTTLPYGGLYRVEINITQTDDSISSLFNGQNANATIEVVLRPVQKAPNYNPFYELPFDGEIGKKESGNARSGYGVGLATGQIRLNSTTNAYAYSNPLKNLTVQTSQDLSELQNGQILSLTRNGLMKYTPTQPTPVFMSVIGLTGTVQAKYNYAGSYASTIGSKDWKLATSTLSANGKCADFEGDNEMIFTDTLMGTDTRGLSWDSRKAGTLGLVTTYFTPKDVESTLRITPLDENKVKLNSYPLLKNSSSIMLNNFDAQAIETYDTVGNLLKMVAEEKVCMTKDAEQEVKFWWNPKYISELEKEVSLNAGSSCIRTRR